MRILVVDAANVVGSVPDGWWRDRPGATRGLHDALVARSGPYDLIVLVVEGQASSGVPVGTDGVVCTVHASGVGDDEIVTQVSALRSRGQIDVATRDRGLIERLGGVQIVSPRSVRDGVAT